MRILIFLGHPAHYHLFRGASDGLKNVGHDVRYVIKSKDILRDLLDSEREEYFDLLPEGRANGYVGVAWGFLKRTWRLAHYLKRERFDLLIGSDPSIAQLGRVFGMPSIITVEDDASVIPHFAWMAFPFANVILAPGCCDVGRWAKRKLGYEGFQKLAYLHPNRFTPDPLRVPFLDDGRPYFLIRLSSLSAHHDFGVKGINPDTLKKLIHTMEKRGRVLISSERPLSKEFEKYQILLPVRDMHHLLFYADLFVGDSQSMAVEAAMLGTPSIRFSDFVGKIGVLEELEHRYGLTFGIPATDPEALIRKVSEVLDTPGLTDDFSARRQRMLDGKIDVTAFLTWLIQGYPRTAFEAMQGDTSWQLQFGRSGEAVPN